MTERVTRTGGRPAIEGVIRGRYALSVGNPGEPVAPGWEWAPLTSLARLESGHTPSRKHPEYWDGDIPWIGIRDATANHGRTLRDTAQHTNELGIANSSARLLPTDTVCLSRTASVGYVVVMGEPMATSQDFVNWVCSDDLDHRFLKYVLLAEHDTFLSFASGTTHQTIYYPEVKAFHVCRPPVGEQRKIAEFLGSIDDLIENNRRRVEVLEEMARASFREWFVRFRFPGHEDVPLVDSPLGPTPAGWQVVASGELQKRGVLEIGDGYRAKNAEMSTDGPGLPFLRVANVQDGYLSLEGADELPTSYIERLRSKVSVAGDVVISMKGTVGRQALVQEWHPRMAYSPQVSYWRSLAPDAISSAYLYEWIRSESFVQQCAAVKGATDMADYVNLTDQRRMLVLVPPASVMAAFTDRTLPVLRLTGHLRAQSASLGALRGLLLPKLVTGQIDVSQLDLDALPEAATA